MSRSPSRDQTRRNAANVLFVPGLSIGVEPEPRKADVAELKLLVVLICLGAILQRVLPLI
jgi:hypothetical protein